MRQFEGLTFFSALVDAFLVAELPHVEKIHFLPHAMQKEMGFSSLMVIWQVFQAITNFFFPIGLLVAHLGMLFGFKKRMKKIRFKTASKFLELV